jgi:hypothetical protein
VIASAATAIHVHEMNLTAKNKALNAPCRDARASTSSPDDLVGPTETSTVDMTATFVPGSDGALVTTYVVTTVTVALPAAAVAPGGCPPIGAVMIDVTV